MFLFLFQVSLPSVSCVAPPILSAHKRYRWHFYHEWEFSAMKFHVNLSSEPGRETENAVFRLFFRKIVRRGVKTSEMSIMKAIWSPLGSFSRSSSIFDIFFYHFVVRNKRFALPLYNGKVSVLYYMYYVLCIFYFPSKPLGRLRNCGRFGIANRVDERFAVGKA